MADARCRNRDMELKPESHRAGFAYWLLVPFFIFFSTGRRSRWGPEGHAFSTVAPHTRQVSRYRAGDKQKSIRQPPSRVCTQFSYLAPSIHTALYPGATSLPFPSPLDSITTKAPSPPPPPWHARDLQAPQSVTKCAPYGAGGEWGNLLADAASATGVLYCVFFPFLASPICWFPSPT
ncbi:hypothetical protein B0T25DRAFT_124430 [Lasiosphaeria hispida]|uniref:Uncharacterized protein n=1 Tax=Lasiosphaeria hispida TaxID=260671 RepID=A0AAJ0HS38_9PEZI|nr:hypothetical protein B0T25DRAFT_124430 [Lasiosphaeria hispida]